MYLYSTVITSWLELIAVTSTLLWHCTVVVDLQHPELESPDGGLNCFGRSNGFLVSRALTLASVFTINIPYALVYVVLFICLF